MRNAPSFHAGMEVPSAPDASGSASRAGAAPARLEFRMIGEVFVRRLELIGRLSGEDKTALLGIRATCTFVAKRFPAHSDQVALGLGPAGSPGRVQHNATKSQPGEPEPD